MILKLGKLILLTKLDSLDGNYHGPNGTELTKGFLFCKLGIKKGFLFCKLGIKKGVGFRVYKYHADTTCRYLEVCLSW